MDMADDDIERALTTCAKRCWGNQKAFAISLSEFYDENGFLTDAQQEALHNIWRKYGFE
jgi:hypothetical protein